MLLLLPYVHDLLLAQCHHVALPPLSLERPAAGLKVAHDHGLPLQVDLEGLHLPLLTPLKTLWAMLGPVDLTLHLTRYVSLLL